MKITFRTITEKTIVFVLTLLGFGIIVAEGYFHVKAQGDSPWQVLPFVAGGTMLLVAGFLTDRKKTKEIIIDIGEAVPIAFPGRRASDRAVAGLAAESISPAATEAVVALTGVYVPVGEGLNPNPSRSDSEKDSR